VPVVVVVPPEIPEGYIPVRSVVEDPVRAVAASAAIGTVRLPSPDRLSIPVTEQSTRVAVVVVLRTCLHLPRRRAGMAAPVL
jgi:hypothetical protein